MRQFLILVSLVLLAGTGYFTYTKWYKDSGLTHWNFVPSNALLIYENHDLLRSLETLDASKFWANLNLMEGITLPNDLLKSVDSVLNVSGKGNQFLSKAPIALSAHLTAKKSLDLLAIIEIKSIQQHEILNGLQNQLNSGKYEKKVREFLGFKITELISPTNTFTFILHKNFFVGSTTAYLVEDAIRAMSSENSLDFQQTFPELTPLIKLQRDHGNIYFNLQKFQDLLNVFTSNQGQKAVATSGFYDINLEGTTARLDGFTFAQENTFLSQFRNASGSLFDMAEIISNDEAIFHHISLTNPNQYIENRTHTEASLAISQKLIRDFDFDPDHVFNLVDEEIGLGVKFHPEGEVRTLYLEVDQTSETNSFFNAAVERAFKASGDSIYQEDFLGYSIKRLDAYGFPEALLGNIGQGFDEVYFTAIRNYFLFSNSLPGLKKNIEDIQSENTWRKSLRKIQFLEKTNPESAYSFYINVPAVWYRFMQILDPKWHSFFSKNEFIIKRFDNLAAQFNQVDDKLFTNVVLDVPETANLGDRGVDEINSITFSVPLIGKPYVTSDAFVKNNILVQDSLFDLYFIDSDFQVKWTKNVKEPILGKIKEIDYYGNGGRQFLITTSLEVIILSEEGEVITGFPKDLPGNGNILNLGLIDYDGTKQYRFGITTSENQTFLTDKEVKALTGWNPKTFKTPLINEPKHYRIGGSDIILIQEERNINAFSRRGRLYPGFPVTLGDRMSGPINLKAGSRFASTYLTSITETGLLLTVDLKSNVVKRDELFKTTANTKFKLINGVGSNAFIIIRQTDGQYDILNEEGDNLFSKEYLDTEGIFIQYYRFSADKQYVIIGNQNEGFLYLYDLNGNLVTNRPMLSSNPISMLYSGKSDEHRIYLTYQNQLTLVSLD